MPTRVRLPHTPYLDGWREELRAATSRQGAKAELAQFLAGLRDQAPRVLQIRIAKILSGASIPNGEDVLAISHWISLQPGHAKTGRRTTRTRTTGGDA
jgi:hypothetical protein